MTTQIIVVALLRNNEEYLRFLENNSSDNTRTLLNDFADKNPRAQNLYLDLEDYKNTGTNFERTDRLAFLRNKAMQFALKAVVQKDAWMLLIDSDIYFELDVLGKLLAKRPRELNIGLLSAFSLEGVRTDNQIRTAGHYYDTFAFVGLDGRNHRPRCVFSDCRLCGIGKLDRSNDIIDVRSCYNGFALLDADLMVTYFDRVKWDTIDIEGIRSLCEHVLFCDRLRTATGARVCVATDVDRVFWGLEIIVPQKQKLL
ncbi:hypothetical protein CEUSTIGMA_g12559.t1 [Chlamydomonas eustigma]|uniref:Glycosyltransferase 2-like domain-containing protein n=1 Tax=Chlamydomonas eustigma TaxID=1157962 RepID=A0A250XQR4_9CHLO|nr:hypothetical protein CEUSTIGMA_g12559.t1 [Chlamydomonas eustigma]|eukprot:GAX85140.1 hypothetical protein CEUSTIGMA_g12559.t1 [Chlamydomonas eustigma]